ncbi:hypothetical protein C8246_04435 [Paracidovorax avenae]|nr:hypothetical protein C8246_04435 [Paracidovorax avenae]
MQPPEASALRARPTLRRQARSRGPQPLCRLRREGGHRQRGGAALARRLLAEAAPCSHATGYVGEQKATQS